MEPGAKRARVEERPLWGPDDLFEVEAIVGCRLLTGADGRVRELAGVRWAGWPKITWEPWAELALTASSVLHEYHAANTARARALADEGAEPARVLEEPDEPARAHARDARVVDGAWPAGAGAPRACARKASLALVGGGSGGVLAGAAAMCAYCGAIRPDPRDDDGERAPCANKLCSTAWAAQGARLGGRIVRVLTSEVRGTWAWGKVLGLTPPPRDELNADPRGARAPWLAIELHGGADGASRGVVIVRLPSRRVQLLAAAGGGDAPTTPATHVAAVLQHVHSGRVSVRFSNAVRWRPECWRFLDFATAHGGAHDLELERQRLEWEWAPIARAREARAAAQPELRARAIPPPPGALVEGRFARPAARDGDVGADGARAPGELLAAWAYMLSVLAPSLRALLAEEHGATHGAPACADVVEPDAWRDAPVALPASGTRLLCNVCCTTIFECHLACECGYDVCLACFRAHERAHVARAQAPAAAPAASDASRASDAQKRPAADAPAAPLAGTDTSSPSAAVPHACGPRRPGQPPAQPLPPAGNACALGAGEPQPQPCGSPLACTAPGTRACGATDGACGAAAALPSALANGDAQSGAAAPAADDHDIALSARGSRDERADGRAGSLNAPNGAADGARADSSGRGESCAAGAERHAPPRAIGAVPAVVACGVESATQRAPRHGTFDPQHGAEGGMPIPASASSLARVSGTACHACRGSAKRAHTCELDFAGPACGSGICPDHVHVLRPRRRTVAGSVAQLERGVRAFLDAPTLLHAHGRALFGVDEPSAVGAPAADGLSAQTSAERKQGASRRAAPAGTTRVSRARAADLAAAPDGARAGVASAPMPAPTSAAAAPPDAPRGTSPLGQPIHAERAAPPGRAVTRLGGFTARGPCARDAPVANFARHWRRGEPLVVTGGMRRLQLEWTPQAFLARFGSENVQMIDCCEQGCAVSSLTLCHFFRSYLYASCRPKVRGTERAQMLKLKDWPHGADFREKLPDLHADLMGALPFKQYAHAHGALNLARFLPVELLPPDLGPKLYCAVGRRKLWRAGDYVKGGYTCLHCDVADAYNLLVHEWNPPDDAGDAPPPRGAPADPDLWDAELGSLAGAAGAVWDIWRYEDSRAICAYLTERAARLGLPACAHPIHDQSCYLDEAMRRELRDEHGVVGWHFIQRQGEYVFIPAGCCHQVRNLSCCIKVAMDFVSPENVHRCLDLAEQFRRLPDGHAVKEDKLQPKLMLRHALEHALGHLEAALAQGTGGVHGTGG